MVSLWRSLQRRFRFNVAHNIHFKCNIYLFRCIFNFFWANMQVLPCIAKYFFHFRNSNFCPQVWKIEKLKLEKYFSAKGSKEDSREVFILDTLWITLINAVICIRQISFLSITIAELHFNRFIFFISLLTLRYRFRVNTK